MKAIFAVMSTTGEVGKTRPEKKFRPVRFKSRTGLNFFYHRSHGFKSHTGLIALTFTSLSAVQIYDFHISTARLNH